MARALALTAGVFAAAGLAGCSPFGGGSAFHCESQDQCNAGTSGKCEANGFCSYADPSCMSTGQRYGENSGGNSGRCVGDEQGDIDAPPGTICYGAGLVKPCFSSAPTGSKMLPAMIDTDAAMMCDATRSGAEGFCVIAGETIQVESTVEVVGTRPLVLVATGTIDVAATLDVASHHSLNPNPPYTTIKLGAGADSSDCATGTVPVAGTNNGGGGGGAGGTFGGLGGVGGTGGTNGGDVGGAGGTAAAVSAPTKLRGGCRGQDGIDGTPGQGGHSGGAVYLIAETSIVISGAINASGEGGHPGIMNGAGGGGGGSGGMIGLDAPTITITNTGVIFANGGSGGEGSGQNIRGNPGPEPTGAGPSSAPLGNVSVGGDGGTGGAGGTISSSLNGGNAGNGGSNPVIGGGGGGGGGGGVLKIFRATMIMVMGNGQHSPNPS